MHEMHDWLLGLTRPEDHLVWAWVAIAAGHAVVGVTLGRFRAPPRDRTPQASDSEPAGTRDASSR